MPCTANCRYLPYFTCHTRYSSVAYLLHTGALLAKVAASRDRGPAARHVCQLLPPHGTTRHGSGCKARRRARQSRTESSSARSSGGISRHVQHVRAVPNPSNKYDGHACVVAAEHWNLVNVIPGRDVAGAGRSYHAVLPNKGLENVSVCMRCRGWPRPLPRA